MNLHLMQKRVLALKKAKIVTNGLVLNLDAGNPLSYPGTGTIWTDLSGNGNNGTLVNGPTFSPANGGSIVFDGVNDYVDCGRSNITPLSYSVGGFFKISDLLGVKTFIAKTEAANNFSQNFALVYDASRGNKVILGAKLTNGTYFYQCISSFSIVANTIYFFYGTYNSSNFTYKLYINGMLNNTAVASFGNTIFPTQMIQIGASDATFANRLKGNAYNAQIYNRALSDSEVLQNYNATKSRFGL